MTKATPTADDMLLEALWDRFRAGDEQAFDQLTRLRYRLLFNYATRFTKDREFIKDCIQDLFLELWQRRANIVSTPYVTVYLVRALRNNLLRSLRQENRLDNSADSDQAVDLSDGMTIERTIIQLEQVAESERSVRQAIDQLPKRQQEAVFLKFYEGMSNEDIARIMDVERQTVANFLYRALTQLKGFLSS